MLEAESLADVVEDWRKPVATADCQSFGVYWTAEDKGKQIWGAPAVGKEELICKEEVKFGKRSLKRGCRVELVKRTELIKWRTGVELQ